ncbi:MAG: hypothetical protein EA401_11965 [Planctomycetota bacterium]|nr:MAG: hypothetical protein EA401_11965 [Planctomycetota bacterium]
MSTTHHAADDAAPSVFAGIPEPIRQYWYLGVIALAFAAVFFYWWRFYAFTDQGYAPQQPIAFSHALHAGEHAIDCSYCHFNAHRGKHAGIPPASVCLGCHSTEMGGVGHGLPEVEKMLSILNADVSDSYTLRDLEYFHMDQAPEASGVETQFEGGNIHWERIHMLPDHVYFSHEFHVAAGVSCQTCHGPVETMEVVYQYADLTMGWCIDCHRNDNYVGGPSYIQGEMETFTVGVGNYDVIRHRIRPDEVVDFMVEIDKAQQRVAANRGEGGGAYSGAAESDNGDDAEAWQPRRMRGGFNNQLEGVMGEDGTLEIVPTMNYFTAAQAEKLERLLEKYPDLPRWRVQDLPETHRAFYGLDGSTELRHLHNAATHCHTCHQ